MRGDSERLQDMLEAIARIERYASQGRTVFDQNELVQTWVIYHLQMIGEAANALSESFIVQYPAVPWARIVGFRNVMVHEYFRVDLNLVWVVVEQNLPDLKRQLEQILQAIGEGRI